MAIKCDNCHREAHYTNADAGVNPVHYCSDCLPKWLHDRAKSGHFPLMEAAASRMEEIIEATEASIKKTTKKKTVTEPVEEAVAEPAKEETEEPATSEE